MRIPSATAGIATGGVLIALVGGLCIALGLGLGSTPEAGSGQHMLLLEPTLAVDGNPVSGAASRTPAAKLRVAPRNIKDVSKAVRQARTARKFAALRRAADRGQPAAQWEVGKMYADGDGVKRDDLRAFRYFSEIANTYADEPPGTAHARIAANAFVALGHYYLKGIPHSSIKPDRAIAHRLFSYAASYFGNADAQYELGRLYLDGKPREPHEAARWFLLSAMKGQCRAEVTLGDILFRGRYLPRQAARGLMWLTLGRDCAGADEPWVKPVYDSAVRHASDNERAMALVYLRNWINGRRD